MEAITGDETGLIKVVDIAKREFLTYGSQDRNASVESLSWLTHGYAQTTFAVLRANSVLEAWKYEPGLISMLSKISLPDLVDPLSVSQIEPNRVMCVDKSGNVSIAKLNDESSGKPNQNQSSQKSSSNSSNSGNWDICGSFQVKGPVGASATCRGGAAFGGSENDVVLYDMNTQQSTWTARNVPYDTLRLRVPVWVAAISFLHPAEDTPSSAQFVTGTGHKHVRLYDIKASQQPSFSIDILGDYRVTSIQPSVDGNALFVGDCSGGLAMWDLRMSKRKIAVLKGSSGSIRSLHMTTSGNHMGTVGLDRFLRVYDTSKACNTKKQTLSGNSKTDCSSKLVCSAYLKNRLNCCIMADSEAKMPKTKKEKKRGEVGDDDKLNKNVNFDSDEDDESEEEGGGEGDSEEGDSDDDEDDEGELAGEDDDDDEDDEDDEDGSEGDSDEGEEDEVGAHEDDSDSESGSDDEESPHKNKNKGKGKGGGGGGKGAAKGRGNDDREFSSRKQRVAAVSHSNKTKANNSSQNSSNKKRKM